MSVYLDSTSTIFDIGKVNIRIDKKNCCSGHRLVWLGHWPSMYNIYMEKARNPGLCLYL